MPTLSPRSGPYLDVTPVASRQLAGVLVISHTAALSTLVLLVGAVPVAVLWLLAILVSLSLACSLRRHVLRRGKHATTRATWSAGGEWTLFDAAGNAVVAQLARDTYVTPGLVILNFTVGARWRRRSLVLLPDSLEQDTLRRLRTRLRTEGRLIVRAKRLRVLWRGRRDPRSCDGGF